MPEPKKIDWNQDGTINYKDEWIELHNLNPQPISMGGWAVADGTHVFTLPMGTVIWPHGYLVLFRGQTHLALGDDADTVTLLRPNGDIADRYTYTRGPGADASHCRIPDGVGSWTSGCQPTLGAVNRLALPPPSATATPASRKSESDAQPTAARHSDASVNVTIWAARRMAEGAQITISGTVTMAPGPLGRRIYVEDETGGIGVYLQRGEYPPLALGDVLLVTGRLNNYYGEAQIEVNGPSRIVVIGQGRPRPGLQVATGAINEDLEGRLVWVMGKVKAFDQDEITVDDGSGPTRVYFPPGLTWRRPFVRIGEMLAVRGIVGQHTTKSPHIGGYRVMPRAIDDIARAPRFLPVTGVQGRAVHE
ncbi:MAG: lamin tail domain-containing protein [Anaerolineae bacterium]